MYSMCSPAHRLLPLGTMALKNGPALFQLNVPALQPLRLLPTMQTAAPEGHSSCF